MTFQTSALLLSWVAILLLALVVSGLVRQVHALSSGGVARPEALGLRPGAPAPGFSRLAPEPPGPLLLLFLDHDCGVCGEVLEEAGRSCAENGLAVRALYRTEAPEDTPVPAYAQQADLFAHYDAIATPFAALIDATGHVVTSEPVGARNALSTLIRRAGQFRELGIHAAVNSSPGGLR